tara:strand:+ start:621 stop:821 length:201 start_codon:yes stop_codon:yes gene_type:complete
MNWRRNLVSDYERFLDWVGDGLDARRALGVERHGLEFRGDPLDHAIEEALDLVFYLWKEKERRDAE